MIGKAREFYARVKAENPEFNLMWDEFYRTLKNTLILEADEEGIKRWKEMLGIIPMGSLEDRRLKVYIEWNSTVIWTDRTLRQFLDLFLGKGTYELEFIYDKYALKIKVHFGSTKVRTDVLLEELRKIIPANIAMFTTAEVAFKPIFAGGRRRVLKIAYRQYEVTDIKGEAMPRFAGYLVSYNVKMYPCMDKSNLVAKDMGGYLIGDIGKIRGEMIE